MDIHIEQLTSGEGPDLQKRLLDMATLQSLSLQLDAAQELSTSLHTVAQTLKSIVLRADSVTIMLLDESGLLKLAASDKTVSDRPAAGLLLRPGEGLRGQVVLIGQALYVPMAPNDRRYIEFDSSTQAILIVPIVSQEQTIGTLAVESEAANAFSEYDQNILSVAAAQTARLVEAARLREHERRQADEINGLIELGKKISQSPEIEPVFSIAYQVITRLMGGDALYISLRETQTPNTSVTYLIDSGVRYPPARWPIESGLSGYVIQTGESILVRDMLKETHPFQGVFYEKSDQVRSLIACPIQYRGKTRGMISCQSYQPGAFAPRDLQMLQSIAAQIAVAVENTEMYTDLNNRYLTIQELEQVRNEIIQNVSHELRTPLTFLRSYIELLADEQLGSLNERQKHSLRIVQARTNTLVRLVDDILILEESDPDWLKIQAVDLAELVANALQVTEQLARERGNQLVLETPPNFPTIQADPDRITQVLDNLLGNALKYGSKASKIVVRLEVDKDKVIVSVSNQGTGIPAREQERIFERFYQIDGSISRSQSGLGLGLAIVKRIIEAHHGTVWVTSDEHTGSTFYFSLPYQVPA